jgi:hypothetical protein
MISNSEIQMRNSYTESTDVSTAINSGWLVSKRCLGVGHIIYELGVAESPQFDWQRASARPIFEDKM